MAGQQELDELLSQIHRMQKLMEEIEVSLKIAKNYSEMDMIGGSLFSDLEKNRTLDEVQEMIKTLDKLASEVREKVKGFQLDTNIHVKSGDALRVEDYIFDDWSSAMHIKGKVDDALRRIEANKEWIGSLAKELEGKKEACVK